MQVSRNEGHFRKNSIAAQELVIKTSIFGRLMLIPLSTRKSKAISEYQLVAMETRGEEMDICRKSS